MISDHATEWLGLPVELFNPEKTPDYAGRVYRLATDYDAELSFAEIFEAFTSNPDCAASKAIIIGAFSGDDPGVSSEEVVQLLVAARKTLPHLRGIFIGDILSEENEISWIVQSDMTPLFEAYPDLEHFRVRGSGGLGFGNGIQHAKLKSLIIESGGLEPAIIRQVATSKLPCLEHLEIWTGSSSYGGDATVADVAPFLDGSAWPQLRSLALRNSEFPADIAKALQTAPVASRLESLDLSLGKTCDACAQALLENPALKGLKSLNLHYNYISLALEEKLRERFPFVILSEWQGEVDEDERYVAVGE